MSEHTYELKTPFEYALKGENQTASFITMTAPGYKQVDKFTPIKQAFMAAISEVTKDLDGEQPGSPGVVVACIPLPAVALSLRGVDRGVRAVQLPSPANHRFAVEAVRFCAGTVVRRDVDLRTSLDDRAELRRPDRQHTVNDLVRLLLGDLLGLLLLLLVQLRGRRDLGNRRTAERRHQGDHCNQDRRRWPSVLDPSHADSPLLAGRAQGNPVARAVPAD